MDVKLFQPTAVSLLNACLSLLFLGLFLEFVTSDESLSMLFILHDTSAAYFRLSPIRSLLLSFANSIDLISSCDRKIWAQPDEVLHKKKRTACQTLNSGTKTKSWEEDLAAGVSKPKDFSDISVSIEKPRPRAGTNVTIYI